MHAAYGMNWMRPRLRTVHWRLPLALSFALTATIGALAQGTPEQREACTPDVFRLCSSFIPNADEITSCLRSRNAELSEPCKAIVTAGMKPSDGHRSIDTRKRTAR